jgi:hypothetical protein
LGARLGPMQHPRAVGKQPGDQTAVDIWACPNKMKTLRGEKNARIHKSI